MSETLSKEDHDNFYRLFEAWKYDEFNAEALESGGTGNLKTLAEACAKWAKTVSTNQE